MARSFCRFPGCVTPHCFWGLCIRHILAWDAGQSSIAPRIGPRGSKYSIICSADGCERTSLALGLCCAHTQRMRNFGDVNYITPIEVQKQACRNAALKYKKASPKSYKKLHGRHEHRVVMERYLGRPLTSTEIVHHIDENKHNNSLENLELTNRSDHASHHFSKHRKRRARTS
jgi:hypothetical protein